MNEQFLIQNEDAILRAQHSAYAEFCAEDTPEYDPDGGYWDFENDKWEAYDDMGR